MKVNKVLGKLAEKKNELNALLGSLLNSMDEDGRSTLKPAEQKIYDRAIGEMKEVNSQIVEEEAKHPQLPFPESDLDMGTALGRGRGRKSKAVSSLKERLQLLQLAALFKKRANLVMQIEDKLHSAA